MLKYHLT